MLRRFGADFQCFFQADVLNKGIQPQDHLPRCLCAAQCGAQLQQRTDDPFTGLVEQIQFFGCRRTVFPVQAARIHGPGLLPALAADVPEQNIVFQAVAQFPLQRHITRFYIGQNFLRLHGAGGSLQSAEQHMYHALAQDVRIPGKICRDFAASEDRFQHRTVFGKIRADNGNVPPTRTLRHQSQDLAGYGAALMLLVRAAQKPQRLLLTGIRPTAAGKQVLSQIRQWSALPF